MFAVRLEMNIQFNVQMWPLPSSGMSGFSSCGSRPRHDDGWQRAPEGGAGFSAGFHAGCGGGRFSEPPSFAGESSFCSARSNPIWHVPNASVAAYHQAQHSAPVSRLARHNAVFPALSSTSNESSITQHCSPLGVQQQSADVHHSGCGSGSVESAFDCTTEHDGGAGHCGTIVPASGSSGADSGAGIATLGYGSIAGSCEDVSIASADDDIGDNTISKDCIAGGCVGDDGSMGNAHIVCGAAASNAKAAAICASNLMTLVQQDRLYLAQINKQLRNGVPRNKRDPLDMAGKLLLTIKALDIGVSAEELTIVPAQAGGLLGKFDGMFADLSGIEIKAARSYRGNCSFQFSRLRPSTPFQHLFLLGRL